MKTKQIQARRLTQGRRVVDLPDTQVTRTGDGWPTVTNRADGHDDLRYPAIYIELSTMPGRWHSLDPRDLVTVLVKE